MKLLSVRAVLVVVACFAATAGAVVLVGESHGAQSRRSPLPTGNPPIDAEDSIVDIGSNARRPLLGPVRRVSLCSATRDVGYPVPTPDTTHAGPHNLTAVYVGKERDVALVYGRGAISVRMQRAIYANARRFLTGLQSGMGAGTRIQTLEGAAALIIAPRTDGLHTNPAWIELDLHGIDVNVVSYTERLTSVLTVARSLAARSQTKPVPGRPPFLRCGHLPRSSAAQ